MPVAPPVLWHLKVSHYNEKARWALDYKRVAHVRRAALPGRHHKTARELTGGATFPVLVLDDQAIGDSTRIIAQLERGWPAPPLYPADPGARHRARLAPVRDPLAASGLDDWARDIYARHRPPSAELNSTPSPAAATIGSPDGSLLVERARARGSGGADPRGVGAGSRAAVGQPG